MTQISSVASIAVQVRDFEACIAFYRLLIGTEIAIHAYPDASGRTSHVAWFAIGQGSRLVLFDSEFRSPTGAQTNVSLHLYCDAPDVLESKLRAHGVVLETATQDTESGARLFIVVDPEGNELAVGTGEPAPWTRNMTACR